MQMKGRARPRGRRAAQPAAAGNWKAPGPFFDWSGPAGRSCLPSRSRRELQRGGHPVRGRPAGRRPSRPSMGNHSGRPEDPEAGLCGWRGSRRAPSPAGRPSPTRLPGPGRRAARGRRGGEREGGVPGCDSCLWNALMGLWNYLCLLRDKETPLTVNTHLEALGPPGRGEGGREGAWLRGEGSWARGVVCTDFTVESDLPLLSAA